MENKSMQRICSENKLVKRNKRKSENKKKTWQLKMFLVIAVAPPNITQAQFLFHSFSFTSSDSF
jgi:hypothetical protein